MVGLNGPVMMRVVAEEAEEAAIGSRNSLPSMQLLVLREETEEEELLVAAAVGHPPSPQEATVTLEQGDRFLHLLHFPESSTATTARTRSLLLLLSLPPPPPQGGGRTRTVRR